MNQRKNFSSGAVWENIVGYSRAVKLKNVIEVSGTVAVNNNQLVAANDPYEQTKFILQKIKNVLAEAGAALEDVVRTRIYVTDIRQWKDVGKAHGEFFGTIKPATTMVEVKSLIDPNYLVEIEATAIIQN